jgi:post-segregation antitoxin (ccd killing protein)
MKIKAPMNCYIDVDLIKQVKELKWEFSELLEFGIKFKLAEMDLEDYPNNKLLDKIAKLQEVIQSQTEQ